MGRGGNKGRGRGKSADPAQAPDDSEAQAAVAQPLAVQQAEVIGNANDEVILEVSNAVQKITDNVLFADIFRATPLTMDGGQPRHLTGHKAGQATKFDVTLSDNISSLFKLLKKLR